MKRIQKLKPSSRPPARGLRRLRPPDRVVRLLLPGHLGAAAGAHVVPLLPHLRPHQRHHRRLPGRQPAGAHLQEHLQSLYMSPCALGDYPSVHLSLFRPSPSRIYQPGEDMPFEIPLKLMLNTFLRDRSFSKATLAGVWNRVLSPEEVAQLAACGPDPRGLVIPWNHDWILNNASFIDVPLDEICEKKSKSLYIKFEAIPYEAARHACAGLGGHLPVPQSLEHAYELIRAMREPPYMPLIWIGATDEVQEGTYIEFHTGKPMTWFEWGSNDPNGLQWQNCLVFEEDFLHDYPCHVSREAMCFLPTQLEWTLRGPCEEDTANYKFSLLHPAKGQVVFRGYYQYEIAEEGDAWVWRNALTDEVLGRLPHEAERWPMGRKNWTIEGEGRLVHPGPLRCDRRPDCHDESDERECRLVQPPLGYHHSLPPPTETPGVPLPIGLKIKIVSLSLSDKDSYLEVTYHLNMTWRDLRLRYHNLKEASRLNQSYPQVTPPPSPQVIPSLPLQVIPLLLPPNHTPPLYPPPLPPPSHTPTHPTSLTPSSPSPKSYLLPRPGPDERARHPLVADADDGERARDGEDDGGQRGRPHHPPAGEPLPDDLSVPEDINVYLGSENHLSVERKYTSKFLCDLDLALYPFDVQRCFMDLEVLSAATDFVVLEEAISTVSYVGAKLLIEYEVRGSRRGRVPAAASEEI
ncbi:putative accessory gland protein Acp29AB-like isoform X2 [Penaeus vannamei]|uniref:Putative accessory gland protein Acp29AB-like isoform X2 n=1 Tax=Penaeus vannamei TaxID=6689 RepID=A0A3R7MLL3_PENVA|nr:putative accessory gland protein Acp29AB-like isoform X2 [Penaeus vannamei]